MTRLVVDASVAVKWFVSEVHATEARRVLREGMELLAPDLIWAEIGNALWRKWRSGELGADEVAGILADFRRYPLQITAGESLYEPAWSIARLSGRTFYDSLYLALAVHAGCPLVTADQRFYNALRATPWAAQCLWVKDAD